MRRVIVVLVIAGVHWLATVGLQLAELETGGLLGLSYTRGHGVIAGLLKVLEFPLVSIQRVMASGGDALYLPAMILNSLLWGVAIYAGYRLMRRKGTSGGHDTTL